MNEAPISVEMIGAAERIAGVAYSDAERELMLDNIAAQIDLAQLRRSVSLPVDLAPATRFDPRLPGWSIRGAGSRGRDGYRLFVGSALVRLDSGRRAHFRAPHRDLSRSHRAAQSDAQMLCNRHRGLGA